MGKIIIVTLIIFTLNRLCKLAENCFDDEDPDMYIDTFSPPSKCTQALIGCTHPEQTDIVVETATTCEDIWTICDVCSEVLNKRTDC